MQSGRTTNRRNTGLPVVAAWLAITGVLIAVLVGVPPGSTARSAGAQVAPVVPGRLLDTRSGPTIDTIDGRYLGDGRVDPGSVTELDVTERADVPADLEAVFLNVTAINPSTPGFITVFPCGSEQPNAANLNYAAGDVVANAVLAQVAAGSSVCIFSSAETHLTVDVNGYVPLGSTPSPVKPARLLETRSGPGADTIDGSFLGAGRVAGDSVARVKVINRGGVMPTAASVMLNVTAVKPSGVGYITVFPCGEDQPNAANLNYVAGDVVANAVLAKVGDDGFVCIYTSAEAHLVVDVNGFVPGGSAPASLSPARFLDTRPGAVADTIDGLARGGGALVDDEIRELQIAGRGDIGLAAEAVLLNVTAIRPGGRGYVTVFPCGEPQPNAANLNYRAGDVVANAVFAQVGVGGKVCFFTSASTHLVVDVAGFVESTIDPTGTTLSSTDSDTPTTVKSGSTTPTTSSSTVPGSADTSIAPSTTAPPASSPTSGDFQYLNSYTGGSQGQSGEPARWNPCQPITYLVNIDRAASDEIAAMNNAIARMEQATGIDMEFVGLTSDGEDYDNPPAGADAVIVFSDEASTPELAGPVVGVGGSGVTIWVDGSGRLHARRDTGRTIIETGVGSLQVQEAVWMHELGHMMGLDHVSDASEIMNGGIVSASEFGDGDRQGLWNLGAAQPCVPDPPGVSFAPLRAFDDGPHALELD